MTEKPPKPEDDKEADRRFNETLGRMLVTPPKPHKDEAPKKRGPKKTASVSDSAEYQALRAAVLAAQTATAEPHTPATST
jgi:hypothetical protein